MDGLSAEHGHGFLVGDEAGAERGHEPGGAGCRFASVYCQFASVVMRVSLVVSQFECN